MAHVFRLALGTASRPVLARTLATGPKTPVEFYYDVMSPYGFIGFELITRYQNKWNIDLQLKPIFLPGLMKAAGSAPFSPVRGQYAMKDVHRLGHFYNIPFHVEKPEVLLSKLVVDGVTLHTQRFVTAVQAAAPDYTEALTRALYKNIWCKENIAYEHDSLKKVAKEAGLPDDVIEKAVQQMTSDLVKKTLKGTTEKCLEHGGFGVPTLVAYKDGEPETFWGGDRIQLMGHIIGEQWHGPLNELSKL